MERMAAIANSLAPASYLLYKPYADGKENPLAPGSPMLTSGIEYQDRMVWADGEVLFSKQQLISTINGLRALVTIKRGGETLVTRVPRLKISDLKLTPVQKAEFEDWQHEGGLKGRVGDLFFIPYEINTSLTIRRPFHYLDEETLEQTPSCKERCEIDTPLQPGDLILAVDGNRVEDSFALFQALQSRHVQIIVKKESEHAPVSWKEADQAFLTDFEWSDLKELIASIGSDSPIKEKGQLRLLNPVTPQPLLDFPLTETMKKRLAEQISSQKKAIEELEDPKQKADAMQMLEASQRRVMLGITLQDAVVTYNPSPFVLFSNVFTETWRTLAALTTGLLSPKWMQGPVGIVQVMQNSWSLGINEALFWMGMISLNLGFLNLLPVPVLDGGHICFALWEQITKKRISSKTMERMIIPFVILLIAFFIYVTYHDLARLLSGFFKK